MCSNRATTRYLLQKPIKKSFDSGGEQLPGERSLTKRLLLVIVNFLLWVDQTGKSINATSCIK